MAKRRKKTKDELTTENELMKLKMMAEFGGDFAGSEHLPPDVENAFLRQINKFHQMHDKAGMIRIYDFIGEPLYNHVHDLSDREVPKELKKLRKLLARKGIVVDTLSGVSDRELYRFITEEVFKQEIQNIRMPNWTIHLIYEEFYPSDEFDIKNQAGHTLALIFDKGFISPDFVLAEEMKNELGLSIDREDLVERIDTFKLGFNQMQLIGADFHRVDVSEDRTQAQVEVTAEYRTQSQKGRRFKPETSEVKMLLSRDTDTQMWMVSQLSCDRL